MARPRDPKAIQLLKGETRPSRVHDEPAFEPVEGSTPPDWLDGPDSVAEWNRLAAILEEHRVLTAADWTMLGHACNLHAVCLDKYRQRGASPSAAELTQLRLMYTEFGLTPASRSKVSAGEPSPKSAFAGLAG